MVTFCCLQHISFPRFWQAKKCFDKINCLYCLNWHKLTLNLTYCSLTSFTLHPTQWYTVNVSVMTKEWDDEYQWLKLGLYTGWLGSVLEKKWGALASGSGPQYTHCSSSLRGTYHFCTEMILYLFQYNLVLRPLFRVIYNL